MQLALAACCVANTVKQRNGDKKTTATAEKTETETRHQTATFFFPIIKAQLQRQLLRPNAIKFKTLLYAFSCLAPRLPPLRLSARAAHVVHCVTIIIIC